MRTLYQLVEDKPTIKEQALEIKKQREDIKSMLDTLNVSYTEYNVTIIRGLLNENFKLEEVKQAFSLII